MSIAVRCRLCGHSYNLAYRFAGQVVRCNECQAAMEVPVPAGRAAAPRYAEPIVAGPVNSPQRPFSAPVLAAPLPAGPLPASPLLAPRKKEQTNVPVVLAVVGTVAISLVGLAAIGFMAVGRLAPTLISSAVQARASTPQTTTPVTLSGNYQAASNAKQFEELLRKLVGAFQGFNNALSQVVDGESARRQADQVVAKYDELMASFTEAKVFTPHITADEDKRLESTYAAQLNSAVDQLRAHVTRIRLIQQAEAAFAGRMALDDLHDRMGSLHGRSFGSGPNPNVAWFQPPALPSFQPPQVPRTGPRMTSPGMTAPHTSGPHMNGPNMRGPHVSGPRAPMVGPRHPSLNHGMRGHGAMQGPRGR